MAGPIEHSRVNFQQDQEESSSEEGQLEFDEELELDDADLALIFALGLC